MLRILFILFLLVILIRTTWGLLTFVFSPKKSHQNRFNKKTKHKEKPLFKEGKYIDYEEVKEKM